MNNDYQQMKGQIDWMVPMSGEEFAYHHAAQMQRFELTDCNQLAEAARHRRAMERDDHKAALRREEANDRERRKAKTMQIHQTEDGVQLYVYTGKNELLRITPLFEFSMTKLLRFRWDGENNHLWQAILLVDEKEIFTPLYEEDMLKSVSRLQTTTFAGLDETVTPGDKNMAWRWLRKKLIALFDATEETVLPSLPGWFAKNGVWHFWTFDTDINLLASPNITQFTANSIQPQSISEVIEEILETADKSGDIKSFSVLLIYRLLALFSRLIIDCPPPMGIVLVGKGVAELAEMIVSPMRRTTGTGIINLDSDRISLIRNNVFSLQDAPAFFVSSSPYDKSTKKRLSEVLSWLNTGFLEGKKITFPFVFYLPELSAHYVTNDMVILQMDKVQLSGVVSAFAKLQSFVVLQVESGGEYWVTEFKRQYEKQEKNLTFGEKGTVLHIAQAVIETVSKMFDIEDEQWDKLQEIFAAGINEIKLQISSDFRPALELFRTGVINMIDSGSIFVSDSKNPKSTDVPLIYFDSNCYCFTNDILKYICERNGLDKKSILFFKQQLDDLGMIKKYRQTGNRPGEFSIDIFLECPMQRKLSVLAVKREFWDKVGGISLYERKEN